VKSIVDLNFAGKQSPKARQLGQEIINNEKMGKIAIWGVHSVARVIAEFFIGVSKKKDIRFFKSEEDALVWLKKK